MCTNEEGKLFKIMKVFEIHDTGCCTEEATNEVLYDMIYNMVKVRMFGQFEWTIGLIGTTQITKQTDAQ